MLLRCAVRLLTCCTEECNASVMQLDYPAFLLMRISHLTLLRGVIGSECHMRKPLQGRAGCVLTSRGCRKGNPAGEVCRFEKGRMKGKLCTVIRGTLNFCVVRRAPALLKIKDEKNTRVNYSQQRCSGASNGDSSSAVVCRLDVSCALGLYRNRKE